MQGDVYSYSNWLTLKAADLYYLQGKSQKEICTILEISSTTASRLLQRARSMGYICFSIPEEHDRCLRYAEQLIARFQLDDAVVVGCADALYESANEEEVKISVAQEGARYLQRIIKPQDKLGVAWGGTMYHLIHLLNPCRKKDNAFITLHGQLDCCDYELDVGTLVKRMQMALGGNRYMLTAKGLQPSEEALELKLLEPQIKRTFDLFAETTISVSGIGSFHPDTTSPLSRLAYLSPSELVMLKEKAVYGDLMLRFFDRNGDEIESPLKYKTLAIPFSTYKQIPIKIIVANGVHKAETLAALLRGGLASVLIIDYRLAEAVLNCT